MRRHTFGPGDFMLTSNGVCRLNPQMARCVVGETFDGVSTTQMIPIFADLDQACHVAVARKKGA